MSGTGPSYWDPRDTPAHHEFRAARDLLLRHRTDHELVHREFRWPRPAHFNWALEWFDVIAAGNDLGALALHDVDGEPTGRHSYRELSVMSDNLACWLVAQGVRRGDRVAVVLGQRLELWVILLGLLKVGAVTVPLYTSLPRDQVADRLVRGHVDHVLCEPEVRSRVRDADVPGLRIVVGVDAGEGGWIPLPAPTAEQHHPFVPDGPTPADDLAYIYFTSGSTAAPKMVAHTHASYPIGHLSSVFWNGLYPGIKHVNVSAPGWAKHSWSSFFVPWTSQAELVAATEPVPAERLPRFLERTGATSLCAPASTWSALTSHLDQARIRLAEATSAGECASPQVVDAVRSAWGVVVRDGYGQTETTCLAGTSPGMATPGGAVGKAMPGYRLTTTTKDEIVVEMADDPVGVTAGYLPDPHRPTRRWHTGDVGTVDDGWIQVLGRLDDVFQSSGHRVSPPELEDAIAAHPAVAEVAVVPLPDAGRGLAPVAVVVPTAGTTAGTRLHHTLRAHIDDVVADALRPRDIVLAAALPRTLSGKVRRAAVRDWVAAGAQGPELTELTPREEPEMTTTPFQSVAAPFLRGLFRDGLPEDLRFEPMQGDGRQDIDIHRLYTTAETGSAGPSAGIVHYHPGASAAPHVHPGFELIYVFDGELEFDERTFGPGSVIVMEPGSTHAPASPAGCTLLVVWEQPVARA